ncbi:MAG: hypothetical protein LBS32_03800 [Clostridiales Family XIII bacterium]|jgi:hypothetical protein|nr:hypothetical protein [Clostridiales Family XIII bacterium]
MKQFIVMAAVLPILMVFVMQLALEQRNQHRVAALQEMVYSAKEQAKQEGIFTPAARAELEDGIAGIFGLEKGEIVIETDDRVKYRKNRYDERELISYRIKVPVKKIMAGNRLMGIADEDNEGWYIIEGRTASEKLE